MRVTAPFKYSLPFEIWQPVMDTAGVTTFQLSFSSKGAVVNGGGGLNLVTENQLPITSQVRNLLDSDGKPIFMVGDEPHPMWVTTSDPQFDPFSRIVGWRHRLVRELPRQFEDLLETVIS